MGKVVFRSVRKERKKIISISVSDEVLDFLDKQTNKSQFICDLVRKAMAEQNAPAEIVEPEVVEPQLPWTDEMNSLWGERSNFIREYYHRFEDLEDRWFELHFGDSGYAGEKEEFEQAAAEFKPDVSAYFEKVLNLPPDLKRLYLDRIEERKAARREEEMWTKCGGDPQEVVWQGWTRLDIVSRFKRVKYYSVQDVAGEMGISYDQAYKNIVPWMKRQGFRVG